MNTAAMSSLPWEIYDNSLYLSGFMAIALMSVTMMLATRPAWLETPFNGLDKIYRLHKWMGILAVVFAALHWLIEMGDDVIKSLFGRSGRAPELDFSGFIEMMRDAAEDVGEWAVYLVFAMLVLTLWKRFPYNLWRYVHRVMPILYLLLVFHSVLLAPLVWWQQPVGLLMVLLLTGGSVASIVSLRGTIGQSRKAQGAIHAISTTSAGIIEVECQLENKWQGHSAGQFAFVTFNQTEGAHPFTIASSDRGDGQVTFQIKALGDYTKRLDHKLKIGQSVTVEGPYGRFNFKPKNATTEQIWIAGGIGVTPFLARLEELKNKSEQSPLAQLHYSSSDSATDPFVKRLQEACIDLPLIQLHIHDSSEGKKLTTDQLLTHYSKKAMMEVWFCGPTGWARILENELREKLQGSLLFHREAFELR
ncbi:MAG: ferric reductase-like transmembrane domain-containing protein [Colwellia polaris]|jgi:predicted ferric reductase|uniref:ferredoxin reductase family protein n=1 Tax=Colwellia polaris TaxID=326537 RepID=UPI0018E98DAF|nr:ferric reductase-like transmembrane domain-containing protein [Colwellia polaris]|tara:strand:+ start:8379 stop:9635 length:1257 start_codon:yes stop_codon:yes gene_type:complete